MDCRLTIRAMKVFATATSYVADDRQPAVCTGHLLLGLAEQEMAVS